MKKASKKKGTKTTHHDDDEGVEEEDGRKPVSVVMDTDVLFEKGLRAQNHHGNIHYRSIVNERKEAYNSSNKRKNKDLVANQVWERIQGRCLTKAGNGMYYCLSKKEVMIKIKQALRDRKRPRLSLGVESDEGSTGSEKSSIGSKAPVVVLAKKKNASTPSRSTTTDQIVEQVPSSSEKSPTRKMPRAAKNASNSSSSSPTNEILEELLPYDDEDIKKLLSSCMEL